MKANSSQKQKSPHGSGGSHAGDSADPSGEHAQERELIRRAAQGDRDARTALVQEHQRNVYNLALRLTGSEAGAECVLQDTFLKVFEKLGEFRGESRLGTWIHRIATNAALMQLRAKKGKHFIAINEEPVSDEKGELEAGYIPRSLNRDPLEVTLNDELKRNLESAIAALPGHLRTAFVLKDLEGLTMAEISERTGKSLSAVKADLHRARVKLRGMLAEFVEEHEHE